jgi:hypothetical protein
VLIAATTLPAGQGRNRALAAWAATMQARQWLCIC